MICFVGTMKKIQIQSVKFSRDLSRIYCIDPIICVCKIHHPSSVHNAMKMAAARPQSVFTADVYLSDNQAAHLRLLLLRMFVLQVGRQWVMGHEGRTGQEHMLFMII